MRLYFIVTALIISQILFVQQYGGTVVLFFIDCLVIGNDVSGYISINYGLIKHYHSGGVCDQRSLGMVWIMAVTTVLWSSRT